tara:strand:+ start:934 stop:3084 length:2151 start_codon:yes stop_codon:yes gene_type:complete
MASFTQLRVLNATGSFGVAEGQINDDTSQLAQTGSIGADNLGESLSYMAAAIRRIHGGDWFSNQAVGVFSTTIKPNAANKDIGATDAEWGDIFIGDGKSLKLGNGQESFVSDAGPGLQIGSSEVIKIGVDANTANIDIGAVAQAKTITIGDDASTKVDVNALAIELDAGSNGYTIDGAGNSTLSTSNNGTLTIDSAGALVIDTDGTDSIDIGVEAVAKTITIGNDASTKVDVNALAIELDSAGTLVGTSTTSTSLTATTTMTVTGGGVSKFGDDTATLDFDGAGAVTETAMASFEITPSGALTMKGGGASKYGDDTATLDFDGDGAVTETGMTSFVISPSGVTTLGGGGLVTLDSSGAANDINIGVEAAAKDIVIGNAASALVDINALAVDIDGVNSVSMVGAGGATFGDDTKTLIYDGSGNLDLTAGTLDIDASGLTTIDVTGNLSIDSSDNSNLSVTGAAKSLVVNAAGGGAQTLQLLSSGSGPTAVQVKGEGGVAIQAGNTKSISIGSGGTAEVMVTPDSTAADSKIKVFAENGTAANTRTANTNALSLQAPAGGVHISGDAVILSGSGAQGVTVYGDGSMTSGKGGAGMLFGAVADYGTFRGKSLFSAGTTVIGALNTLADNITGATATIFTGSIATNIAAGGNATVKKQAGDNAALAPDCGIEKAQVYVNGQLLVSSSIGATNDYRISANDTIIFEFDLRVGDMIMVVDRS